MTAFDWRNPDYSQVRAERATQLARIRERPEVLPGLREHYRHNVAAFINSWGMTSDPRLVARGLPSEVPFLLFERQVQCVDWVMQRLLNREGGLIEKSRDVGLTWLAAAISATLCLLTPGTVIGFGSRKEDLIDRPGDPASIFWKIRFFLKNLPPEFRGSWDESRHAQHLRVQLPDSPGAAIVGEAGDSVGRGARTLIYWVDESAHLEHPALIERSLASTTEVRLDVSTPCGRNNPFATKRFSGRVPVFTFHWSQDPRKDQAWYERQCEVLDPITRAQELDLDYSASVEGVLIPAPWIHSAIGAHTKLGIEPSGGRRAALDAADVGRDKNVIAARHGILLEYLSSWSGKGSDIYATTVRAINACDKHGYPVLDYDADGLGAGVRGDAVQINEARRTAGKREIEVAPFRGSGAVVDPDGSLVEGRLNRDFFANLKAQAWWSLRIRFQQTHRAVVEGHKVDPDSIISLSPDLPELHALVAELSQPTYSLGGSGKILVDKVPDGAASPNLADAVMMVFSGLQPRPFFAPTKPAADSAVEEQAVTRWAPTPLPAFLDYAFAVMSFVGDVAACVWVGANRRAGDDGSRGAGFYVLNWDLRQLGDAELWARAVREVLGVEAARLGALGVLFVESWSDPWCVLLRQRGFGNLAEPLPPVPEFPAIADRFALSRPYVAGGHVCIAPAAFNATATLRGQRRNYLRELLQGEAAVNESNPLAVALSTAVLIVFRGRGSIPSQVPMRPVIGTPHDVSESPAPWRGFRIA
jgi:phage terminase large subunit